MQSNEDLKKHQAEIIKTLTPYLMALPQSKINSGSLVVYAKALSSLSITEIDAAMLKLMRTMKWFPTVAEIFEQVDDVKRFAANHEIPTADEAWHEAMKLAHDKWLYGKWEYSCKEVERAIDNFGKRELCTLESEGINTARSQFMRIYSSIVQRNKNNIANHEVVKSLSTTKVNELVGMLAGNMDANKIKEIGGK